MTTKRELNRIKIQTLSSQNLSIKEIAEVVGVDYKTAKKWSKEGYHHHYNTKQKTKLSPVTKRLITKEMKDKLGSSLRRCKNLLNNSQSYRKRNKTISKDTINSYVKSTNWDKIPRKLCEKPLLSKLNTNKRLKDISKFPQERPSGVESRDPYGLKGEEI